MTYIIKPAAVVIKDKKLLVARSSDKPQFYAVGGKREVGETNIECLHREVLEEIGCVVKSEKFYKQFIGPGANSTIVELICYFTELDGDPRPCSEIAELMWVDSQTPSAILGNMITEFLIPALVKDGLVD